MKKPLIILLLILPIQLIAWPLIQQLHWQQHKTHESLTIMLPKDVAVKPIITQQKNSVLINLPHVTLAPIWLHQIDLSDHSQFASELSGAISKQGSLLTIDFKAPVTVDTIAQKQKLLFNFKQRDSDIASQISLNLQNVPVRQLLQKIANLAGEDIVVSDKVKGNISLNVVDKSWRQLLDMVLHDQGLVKQQVEGVWYIAPASLIAKQDKALSLAHETSPLELQIVHLHFANATHIAKMLTTQQLKLLGPRSSVIVNQRMNTLVIHASQHYLNEAMKLIKKLDQPVPQVHISAKVVVIDQSGLKALGLLLKTAGGDDNSNGGFQNAALNLGLNDAAGVLGFGLGKITGHMLSLELQAIQSEGNGKIIASPELTVADNHQAVISQGDEVPYQTSTPSGATQVEFKPATLSLQVTPQITADDQLALSLKITKDSITQRTGTAGATPIIATSAIQTQVQDLNGKTVMLGGIKINEHQEENKRVPYLSHIPLLGLLFQHHSLISKQMDLLVFVTPTIENS